MIWKRGQSLGLDFSRFKTRGGTEILPACVQDADSKKVLLIGFASRESVQKTQELGVLALWSFSRDQLWVKGRTSGNALKVIETRVNCEQNSLLYLVRAAAGGACHTKAPDGRYRHSCYYRRVAADALEFVAD